LLPAASGEWRVSDTRFGPLVHARLGIAQENSGKLVSLVRREARALATSLGRRTLICDGSPGVGCPVIASIGGAQLVLVVTEPTLSAVHDMRRVVELTRHFRVPTVLCLNKMDLNRELAAQVRREAEALFVPVLGQLHYDPAVTRAMVRGVPVVEEQGSLAGRELRELWERLRERLEIVERQRTAK
jgi:MinD superfamily P-loop ATPase